MSGSLCVSGSVEEGVWLAGFCVEMVWASYRCCSNVLGNQPWINVMRDQYLRDCWDVPMFTCIGSPLEVHNVGCMHLVVGERCNYCHCMFLWDGGLLLLKWVFVCNLCEIIQVALDKYFYHGPNQHMGIAERCKLIIRQESWGDDSNHTGLKKASWTNAWFLLGRLKAVLCSSDLVDRSVFQSGTGLGWWWSRWAC